jgi:hypothetical protein
MFRTPFNIVLLAKFKLPDASILNCVELYFKDIVFDVFKNGFEKVNFFFYYYLMNLMNYQHYF